MAFATNLNRIQSSVDGVTQTAVGDVLLNQSVVVTTTADGLAVSGTVTLPTAARITSFTIDTMVTPVVGGGNATTVPITVGTAAAGTQYVTAVDMVAGGRASPTFTTAQLLAMSAIGTNTSVVMTVDPNGTVSTTQGVYRLNVFYVQTV